MHRENSNASLDRRLFLGASALTLLGASSAFAQEPKGAATRAGGGASKRKTLSQAVADYVAGFDLKNVPPQAIDRARVAFIDTIGVMLAGSREEVSTLACEMVKAEGSAPAASVVGQSFRASPQLAALANGVAGHAMDYDLTYLSGQSIAPVIPAILPVAETTGATPSEALSAFIIGAELAGRIVRSNFHASNRGGWHTTGIVGPIAAAAACARLLKVPVERIPDVLGISISMASGVSAAYGTMTKPLHSGNAARAGVMAAQLGLHGFTAHASAFEAHAGYFNTFGRGLDVDTKPFDDLGRRSDLVSIGYSIKAYPCGGRGHTAIEAALALRERLGQNLSGISNIHCSLSKSSATRVGTDYPSTVEAAKFSASYVIAYALVHGAPRISAFTEEALKDERVKAVAKLVTASGDPDLPEGMGESPAKLKITLANGQVLEERRDYATGSSRVPMTQAQLEAKFLDCAAQTVSAEAARKILATLGSLPEQKSFDAFWPMIRRA